MTHRSHVPKFGNWDGDNVPYTAYFENARKEKAGGAAIMNPNDPEENPEAFMFGGFGGTGDLPPAISVETRERHLFTVGHEKHHHHLQINEAGAGYKHHRIHHQRNASSDQQRKSSPSSEKSNSSRSSSTVTKQQQQVNHRRKTSDGQKSFQSSTSSNGFASRPSKGGRNPSEDLSSRSSSVPKFGAWDESDPKSGEGFTVIFNKVKEEKQITAAKFPPAQPDTIKNRETQRNEPKHKMFCCLF